jgi:hypothetical protein
MERSMSESVVTPIPGFHQVAYVTTDFDRALEVFGEVHRAKRFLELRGMRYPTGPGREAHCNIGLAYVGATELEIIEPLSGDVQIYRDFLAPDAFAIRFHHLSRFLETQGDFERQLALFERMGKQFPIRGEISEIGSYFYADFRAELGHYVECITFTEKGREWVRSIPRN